MSTLAHGSSARSRVAPAGLAVLLLAFALIGAASAVEWVGRPFAGFLVLGNRVVASAGLPSWPATRGGEIFQRTLVSVEGQPVERAEDLRRLLETRPEGSTLRYRLAGDGGEIDRAFAVRRFDAVDAVLLFGSYLVNGALLGGLAIFLLTRRGLEPGTRAAAPFLACAALWGLSGMDLYGAHVLFRAHVVCEALLFATSLQMALQFPTRLYGGTVTRRVVGAGYAASAVVALLYQTLLFEPSGYVGVHLLATSLGGLGLLSVLIALAIRFARRHRVPSGPRLGVLVAGAGLALLLPVLLTVPELATGGRAPQNLTGWTVFVFPLAIAYAVCRHEMPVARDAL